MSVDPDLVRRVRARLLADPDAGGPSAVRVAEAVRAEAGATHGDAEVLVLSRLLRSELAGAGPLEPLLREPGVTDVLVNGPEEVWVDRGAGLVPAGVRFADDAAVRRLAQRLAAPTGRRLDDAQPWVDARLADGTRLHAVLPPLSATTLLSLRIPRGTAFTLEELMAAGSVHPGMADLLRRVLAARLAFLVTGGTGTGKTTLLSTLLGLADPRDRIVVVEDASELRPAHPHVVRLEARPANLEGRGAVTLRDLVRQALRMRPDRLVVGEVRGPEVLELLAALNTGHEGGCGTVHANGPGEVPARLEALAATAGLPRAALHSQLGAGLHAVVHLVRRSDGRREVSQLRVLVSGPDGLVQALPAWWVEGGRLRADLGADRLDSLLGEREVGPVAVGRAPARAPGPGG